MTQRTPIDPRAPHEASVRSSTSTLLLTAGILGATGVALGAFGAHGLERLLAERGTSATWETAVLYHLLHAVALLALAPWLGTRAGVDQAIVRWTPRCWTIGTLLFSGSLYALALGGPRWFGPVTPLGGAALIAGWVLLAVAAAKKPV